MDKKWGGLVGKWWLNYDSLGYFGSKKIEQKWVLIVFVFQNKYFESKILFGSRKKCSLLISVEIKLYDTSEVRLRWDFKWTWLLFGIKLLLADDGDTFSSCISEELSIESRCTPRKKYIFIRMTYEVTWSRRRKH